MIGKAISSSGSGGGFGSLESYLEERQEIDPETGEIKDITLSDDLVMTNCLSRETAAAEMEAVANQNGRIKNPVYHAVVSWRENENPTDQQMFEAAAHLQEKLGMAEHQYFYAIHHDTGNNHIHLSINRVHPETGKAQHMSGDRYKIMEAMRELEIKQGWEIEKSGSYKVIENSQGEQTVQRLSKTENAQRLSQHTDSRNETQKDMEAHTGKETLLTYAQGEPKKDLLKILKDPTANWQEVHKSLTKHGLEIKPYGQGLVISEKRENGFNISASSVNENLSLSRLTKKLGEYTPPIMAIKLAQPEQKYNPHRDIDKRTERREERAMERAIERAQFKEQYNAYRTEHRKNPHTRPQRQPQPQPKQKKIGVPLERPDYNRSSEQYQSGHRRAAVRQPDFDTARRREAPESINSVRNLSSIDVVHNKNRTSVLLQTDAPDHLGEQSRVRADTAMRRSGTGINQDAARVAEPVSAKERYKAISDKAASDRKAITASTLTPKEKRAYRSVISFDVAKEKAALQADLKAERIAERAAQKPDSLQEWAAKQAENGNQAAISYLRGQDYAAKRKEAALRHGDNKGRDSIDSGEKTRQHPIAPHQNAFDGMHVKVNRKTGDVSYLRDGHEVFRDTGDRISMGANAMKGDANMEAALRLAAEKFKNGMVLTGSEAFQRKAMEVMIEKGIKCTFSDKDQAAAFESMKNAIQADREKKQSLPLPEAAQEPQKQREAVRIPVKQREREREGPGR